jgi:S1-C subfamily serine protease
MLKKTLAFFLMFLLLAGTLACRKPYVHPQPFGEISRQKMIDKHLKNRSLDSLEGLWVWDDKKYEACILGNRSLHKQPYDYVAIVTDGYSPYWSLGDVKMYIDKTASKGLFSAIYYTEFKYKVGTTIVMLNNNMLKLQLPSGPYGMMQTTHLIRTYPLGKESVIPASGTGFFIADNIVATNAHVVEGGKNITVTFNGTKMPATVLIKDATNDLALLKVQRSTAALPVNIGDSPDTKDGDKVFCVGYPLAGALGKRAKVSEGIINSITGIQDDPRTFQISIPIQPGNSGSPLFNDKGQVIGVVSATINNEALNLPKGNQAQNVNYAVKISYLTSLLSLLPDKISIRTAASAQKVTAVQIMSSAKRSVVFIEVKK